MEKTVRWLTLFAVIGLLAAILVILIQVSRNGIRISYSGDLQVVGMPNEIALRMTEPVELTMPEGTKLTAAFPDGESIPLAISLVPCPACGGSMVPVRWNLLTGAIEWACPNCGNEKLGP